MTFFIFNKIMGVSRFIRVVGYILFYDGPSEAVEFSGRCWLGHLAGATRCAVGIVW